MAEMMEGQTVTEEWSIDSFPSEFFEDEVSRILLQSAIVLRILDDESQADPEERIPFVCGDLEQAGHETALTLREACNKILHAKTINFDVAATQSVTPHSKKVGAYFNPLVYLYGTQHNKEWRATIKMRVFLNHAARLLRAQTLSEHIEWETKYGRT